MKSEQVDILVIGAGPTGTMAAAMVNKNGLKVKIVENVLSVLKSELETEE